MASSVEDTRLPPAGPAARRAPRAVREFLATESAGGAVLLAAALVALVWANSPWRGGYEAVWGTELTVRLGSLEIAEDLRHWVNDALMALFFFVVGLEIKRELVAGELRQWRAAALPAVAALGGMVVPALIYFALNAGKPGARGWGVPMATDIAFAVGVVALLGRRVPPALKLFLLTLAVVDDIGAIVVIAAFYAGGVRWEALVVAAGLLAVTAALYRARLFWMPANVVLGIGVWLATFESGIHPTMAGVALGLLTPARPLAPAMVARRWASDLTDDPSAAQTRAMTRLANSTVSLAERLEHKLHPLTGFAIVPLFALANAGVTLHADALDAPGAAAVGVGVVAGLVVGKLVGVTGFAWLSVRAGVGRLPHGLGWSQVVGAAAVAGIGFTVSIFIAGLAFTDPGLQSAAKLGTLAGSLLASIVGAGWLALAARDPASR